MIHTEKRRSGFTVVELMIVVVIIGILAAIVIVAYAGITSQSRKSAAEATATAVQKKIEAYNTAAGSYPTTFGALGADDTSDWYLPIGTGNGQTNFKTTVVTSSDTTSTVNYYTCGSGYAVQYWDAVAGSVKQYFGGGVSSLSGCTLKTS